MVKVGCIRNLPVLLVGCLVSSVTNFDLAGAVKKKRATSGFGFQVMLGWYLYFSDAFILQLSFVNRYKIY